jgi:hypothetical protein
MKRHSANVSAPPEAPVSVLRTRLVLRTTPIGLVGRLGHAAAGQAGLAARSRGKRDETDDGCHLSDSNAVSLRHNAQSACNADLYRRHATAYHAALSAAAAAAARGMPRRHIGPRRFRLSSAPTTTSAPAAIHAATSRPGWRKGLGSFGWLCGRSLRVLANESCPLFTKSRLQ